MLENNVRHMNGEIMSEYTLKIEKKEMIEQIGKKAELLKEKKKEKGFKKLHGENKLNRLFERLVYLATHPFEGEVKQELKALILAENDDTEENAKVSEEKERCKRE